MLTHLTDIQKAILSYQQQSPESKIEEYVSNAILIAKEVNIDPVLLLAVISVESNFNPNTKSHAGAEGLMLRRAQATYKSGRSDDHLKVKTYDDAEARVIAHLPGSGQYAKQTGALLVETKQGLRFKLGTGLSAQDRQTPPTVGEWVTYRYRGLTDKGVPRFASFMRVQPDLKRQP
jgi:hypothetical protein